MNDKPLVSIVITSFNRVDDLKETVKKTGDITYPNLEIIIVDGGSTDGSVEYLNSLDRNQYVPLVLGVDEGAYITVTQGMKLAKGKYIITIDDDCFLRPSVVKKTIEIFESNPNLAIIGYGLRNPKGGPHDSDYWRSTDYNVAEKDFSNSYQTMNYGSASAFRKNVLEEVCYIDPNWSWSAGGGDNELNFKVISYGYNTALIPELVAYHRVSPKSRHSGTFTRNCINSVIWILLKYYPFSLMIKRIIKIAYYSIFYGLLFRKFIYVNSVFRSINKSGYMLSYKKRIKKNIANELHLPVEWLFSHDREKEVS